MNLAIIDQQGGTNSQSDFEKYFKNTDLFELLKYDAAASKESCETLKLLLERDGFPIQETPTNIHHVAYLREMKFLVKGITLNTNLYTNKEVRSLESEEDEMIPRRSESSDPDHYISDSNTSNYSSTIVRL